MNTVMQTRYILGVLAAIILVLLGVSDTIDPTIAWPAFTFVVGGIVGNVTAPDLVVGED